MHTIHAAMAAPLELFYFPLYAKGLGPALVAEFSGLAWKGPAETGWESSQWRAEGGLKASGASPFGQLPLLKTGGPAGNIGQTVAIVNFIGKTAGPALEGTDEREYAVSQMLICEAEDLYSLLQKDNPTIYAPLSTAEKPSRKGDLAAYGTLWATTIPGHLEKLEALCTAEGGFTKTGATAGELLLFAYLYQMSLCKPDVLAATPKVGAWYAALLRSERVQKVVTGKSSFGEMKQYFITPAPAAE